MEVFCPVVGNREMHQFVTFRGCWVWGGLGSPRCWWQWMFGDTSWLIAIVICQLATITWNWPQSHQVTHSLIAPIDPDVPHNPELRLWILKTEPHWGCFMDLNKRVRRLANGAPCVSSPWRILIICLSRLQAPNCQLVLIAVLFWWSCVLSVDVFFLFVFSYFAFILSQQSGSNHPSVWEWVS